MKLPKFIKWLFVCGTAICVNAACSDDQEEPKPEPPIDTTTPGDPGEPTSYSGENKFVCDTVPQGVTGGNYSLADQYLIRILNEQEENLLDKTVEGNVRDNKFYFRYNGKEYRIGDQFPFSTYAIDFKLYPPFSQPKAKDYINMGRISGINDVTFHWPEKNLTVYIRTHSEKVQGILLPNTPKWQKHINTGNKLADVYINGIYVNGHGGSSLTLTVLNNGNVRIACGDYTAVSNLK